LKKSREILIFVSIWQASSTV